MTRCGELVDIHVRDAEGRTVATVTRRTNQTLLVASTRCPPDRTRRSTKPLEQIALQHL